MGWSLRHACCTECGMTDRPHRARGLCRLCYGRMPEAAAVNYRAKKRRRNTDEGRRKAHEDYLKTRDQQIERVMARYHADPDYRFSLRISNMNYRARQAGCTDTITVDQALARIAFYGDRCYLCGGEWEHLDHVKPLSAGGLNLASNIRPACGTCNVRKHSNWDGPKALAHA